MVEEAGFRQFIFFFLDAMAGPAPGTNPMSPEGRNPNCSRMLFPPT